MDHFRSLSHLERVKESHFNRMSMQETNTWGRAISPILVKPGWFDQLMGRVDRPYFFWSGARPYGRSRVAHLPILLVNANFLVNVPTQKPSWLGNFFDDSKHLGQKKFLSALNCRTFTNKAKMGENRSVSKNVFVQLQK